MWFYFCLWLNLHLAHFIIWYFTKHDKYDIFHFISLKTHFLLGKQLLFRTDSMFHWITSNSLVSTGTHVDTGCLGNSFWSRYTHRGSPSQCWLPPGPPPGDSVAGASPTDTHTKTHSQRHGRIHTIITFIVINDL